MLLGYNVQSTNDWHNQNLHKLVNINRIYSEKKRGFCGQCPAAFIQNKFSKIYWVSKEQLLILFYS